MADLPTNVSVMNWNLGRDDQGRPLYVLNKIHQERKFDFAMAAVLSWRARVDALLKGAKPAPVEESWVPIRVR